MRGIAVIDPQESTPAMRALATANHLSTLWACWLASDAERVAAIARAKPSREDDNGAALSEPDSIFLALLPEELRGESIPDFPPRFMSRLNIQPLVR